MLSDTGNHPPPTSGAQDYNSMARVGLNGTYFDSVFGETVKQLTDVGAAASALQLYSFHNVNADGTFAFNNTAGGFNIIRISDGTTAYSAQPTGLVVYEVRWHMIDPNKYCYFSGSDLVERNLSAQTSTTLKTFPSALQSMGGTANYWDRTQRYTIVQYGGAVHLWDSQDWTAPFTNSITPLNWAGITPSGNNIVTQAGAGTNPNIIHSAFPVNYGTKTIAATPVQYWGIAGDHAALISPSDGNDYGVIADSNSSGNTYLMNLATDNGTGNPSAATQLSRGTMIIPVAFFVAGGHYSAVSIGANADWCFFSSEAGTSHGAPALDDFNTPVGAWQAFKQEIIAVNVLTGALRRLCHHRSRGDFDTNYFTQPKVSCSPKGDAVVWASNFNDSSPTNYADMYLITNPLGSSTDVTGSASGTQATNRSRIVSWARAR